MDKLSKEARSVNMSKIHSKETIPEEIVRKYLFSKGLRFRKNDRRYPGKPDVVLPRYKTVVFVNGCFWHCHSRCKDFSMPKTNKDFWQNKLKGNVKRDEANYAKLKEGGWKVIIVWECELKNVIRNEQLERLYHEIIRK
jgi:DNA mismatch endonuclease, patch repair protein